MEIFLYALLGGLVGVLVNRAADNLPPPARLSLLQAPVCPHCGQPRGPVAQSGLLSLILYRGRCEQCLAPVSLRAPIVELGLAVLFGLLCARLGLGLLLVTYSVLTVLLALITIIDLEHRLILNVVVLPATLVVLVLVPLTRILTVSPPPRVPANIFLNAVYGLLVGYLFVAVIYFMGMLFGKYMAHRRGRSMDEVAFGMGDVKLAGMVGGIVGITSIFSVLVYTILLGGLVSLVVVLFQLLVRRRYSAFMAIPYGPFFTVTTWIFMALGASILSGL